MNRVLCYFVFFVGFVSSLSAGSAQIKILVAEYSNHFATFGNETPVTLPPYIVRARPTYPVSEDIIRKLERMFAPRKESSVLIVGESLEKEESSYGLKDSLAEFAMIGSKQIRELKGGVDVKWFSSTTTTLYLWKSGISWHPQHNKYVTYTFGPKMRWSYRYHNYYDLRREVVKRPIMFLTEIVEKPVNKLFGLDR